MVLRRVLIADATGVLASHGDPRVYAFDPHEVHTDLAHSQRFLAPMVAHWERTGFGYWSVLVPADWWSDGERGADPSDGDRVHAGLGGVTSHAVAGTPVLNVYFRLALDLHGRGLAGLIVAESVRIGAVVAPGVDLVVRTRPGNAIARRVAERAGFIDEGLEPGTTDMQLLRLTAPPTE